MLVPVCRRLLLRTNSEADHASSARAAGMAAAGGQAHPVALNNVVAFVLQDPNLLGLFLRADPATQASIDALHALKLVCKSWLAAARLVLADAQWLAPFIEAAEAFLLQVPLLLHNVMNPDDEGYKYKNASATLVLGVRSYRSHAGVQEARCKISVELAGNDDDMKAILGNVSIRKVISAMATHVGDAGVQQRGCGELIRFAIKVAEITRRRRFRGRKQELRLRVVVAIVGIDCPNIIRVVLTGMKAHIGHADVQKAGWTALGNLTTNDNETEIAIALDTRSSHICVVLSAMRAHKWHAGVQAHGCVALYSLTNINDHSSALNPEELEEELVDDNRAEFMHAGGIGVVLAAMKVCVGHVDVQVQGCQTLRNLANNNNDNKTAIMGAGGIRMVLSAMTAHVGHLRMQGLGCQTLCTLISDNDNVVVITGAGNFQVDLSTMTAHAGHGGMQLLGCQVLRVDSMVNMAEIAAAGGLSALLCIHLVLAAMTAHAGDNSLALNPQQVDCQGKMTDAGGIEWVLAVMTMHVGQVGVQVQGCQVLSNLANNKNNKTAIMRAGGFSVVLSAMTAHVGHVCMQVRGCQVLCTLVSDNDHVLVRTGVGVFQAVMSAMKMHEKDLDVQLNGCKVLATLACDNVHVYVVNGDNTTEAAGADQICVVLSAMTAHTGHEGVQEHGCVALHRLTMIDGRSLAQKPQEVVINNQMEITDADGINVVLAAMYAHVGRMRVQLHGCGLLANLACIKENNTAIVVTGGIRVAVKAMMTHVAHTDVQWHGCKLLRVLARKTANIGMIVGEGGIRVVLEAMRAHPEHAVLQQYGCGALGVLGWSDLTLQKRIKDEGGVGVVEAAVKASGATCVGVYLGQTLLNKLARV